MCDIKDNPEEDLLKGFNNVFQFIEKGRQEGCVGVLGYIVKDNY